MSLPYLTAQTPASDAINVLVNVNPTVTVQSATNQIVKTTVDLYLVTALGQIQVYDGGTDAFHTDYPGTITASGFGWILAFDPDVNLYETYRYGIRVVAQDDIAQAIDETYYFSTEMLGRVKNSGFEAPSIPAVAGQAFGWTITGEDPSAQFGIKRARVQNPPIMAPSEGDFILSLGTIDLTEVLPDALSLNAVSDPVDFTTYITLRIRSFKIALANPQPSGVAYTLQVKIDETVKWSRAYTDADSGVIETGEISFDVSAYSGPHVIKIQFRRAVGEWATFDLGSRFSEVFDNWGGDVPLYLSAWDDDEAVTVLAEDWNGW